LQLLDRYWNGANVLLNGKGQHVGMLLGHHKGAPDGWVASEIKLATWRENPGSSDATGVVSLAQEHRFRKI